MNATALFHKLMKERRTFPRGSVEWDWRTRAARKLWLMARGVSANEWSQQ